MKNFTKLLFFTAFLLQFSTSSGQSCDVATPSYTMNLTGKRDSIWISPSVSRYGLCCTSVAPDLCVEFWVTLDPGAVGIILNIASGAVPPGALYYQNNCTNITTMADTMFLSGVGPHRIVFCKPGNNLNSYSLTSIPLPVASFTSSSDTTCVNACLGFSGTNLYSPLSWNWSFPGATPSTSTLQNPPAVCYNSPGSHNVTLVVNNSVGSDTTSSVIYVNPNTNITGQITYSGGAVDSGNVYLVSQGSSSSLYDTVAVTSIIPTGYYTFGSVNTGNYYLRAEANTTAYPNLVNTYYGDEYLWDSATVINHGCATADTANIAMIELPALSGTATISGTIYEGLGFGQKITPGNPVPYANAIPGVPVKVGKNPSGTIVASGNTNTYGVYSFDNLPIDDYTIYVDIPGYPMDSSYHISITSNSDSIINLDYVVDSNSVYIDLTLPTQLSIAKSRNHLNIFPNPVKDKAIVTFDVTESSIVNFELYNLQGEKVATFLNSHFEKGKYNHTISVDEYNIINGTYLLKATVNNASYLKKLVVIR